MSVDTIGRLKGFIDSKKIIKYLQTHYDKNASGKIDRKIYEKINNLKDVSYNMNTGSQDNDNWYVDSGVIEFNDGEEDRAIFYSYSNINFFENLKYYRKLNLEDMCLAETTTIMLGCYGNSVEIIKNMLKYFNGGWLDEDDYDDISFEYIKPLQIKLGGIYSVKNTEIFYGTHFVVIDTNDILRCMDIDMKGNSNQSASKRILNLLQNRKLDNDDFWIVDNEEDILNISDGYLGLIPIPLVKELKDAWKRTLY